MLWGIAIGVGLDLLFGGDDGPSKSERRAMSKQEADASYEFGKDTYGYAGQLRENAEDKYANDYASMRANAAASGMKMGSDQWEAEHGALIGERDDTFKEADMEMDRFRASENYSGFSKDFDRQKGGWSGGKWSMGESIRGDGTSLYSDEQRDRLMDLSKYSQDGETRGMMDKALPSIEDYEHLQFGSDDQKAAATKRIDERLTSTEKWFSDRKERADASKQNAKLFRGR